MAKKTKTDKEHDAPVAATKELVKKATTRKVTSVAKTSAKTGQRDRAPVVTPKTTKRSAAKPKAPPFSREDVALRAYYIGENRQKYGLPGNSSTDWIEAERQLNAETKKPVRKGTARKAAKKV